MVLRAVFGVVFYKMGRPFKDGRILVEYEHQGLFGAVLPGGRLTDEESVQYESVDSKLRNVVLVSALKREAKEEMGNRIEIIPDDSRIYMEHNVVTSHRGDALSGEIYLIRASIVPDDPLTVIGLSDTPLAFLNDKQLREETKAPVFGKILSDPVIGERLSLSSLS